MKDNHGRVARWYLALQPYDYEVVHRAGRLNGNADGLSRETASNLKEGEMSENPLTAINHTNPCKSELAADT